MANPRDMPILEQLAYYRLRYIWKRREELTPSGEQTWREWWEARHGRTVEEAAKDYGRRQ